MRLKHAVVPGQHGKPNGVLRYDGRNLTISTSEATEGGGPDRYVSNVLVFNVWDLLKAMFKAKFLGTKF